MNVLRTLFLFFTITCTLYSANWVMLQGTEKKPRHKLWGFFQIRVEDNDGETVVKNGINKTPFSYIKPDLQREDALQMARFRVGLRGSFTKNNKINYFFLSELGKNGITQPINYQQKNYITDASLTFKHLPVYVRVGRFKYAGSEEGLMARFASPFINFTTLSNQLMLERYLDTSKTQTVSGDTYLSKPSQGVGAYRDLGIQLFKTFRLDKKESLTLSYMLGNGSGMAYKNLNSNHYTQYIYAAYETLFGKGKGYREESYKLYGWYQSGKRQLYANGDSKLYDRIRYGVGFTYVYDGIHVEGEYMRGRGMIFTGAKDIESQVDSEIWNYEIQAGKDNRADGYYLLATYPLLSNLDLIARYDEYNRMKNRDTLYREFKTFTTGFSYRFKGYDRLDVNYAINSIKAPYNSAANNITKSAGNLLSLQYTMVFK